MRQARTIATATIALVAVFVLLQALIRRSGARSVRRGSRAVSDVPDVGLIPGPEPDRRFGVLALIGWILVTTLSAGVVVTDTQEQRAAAVAVRQATKVSTVIIASNLVHTFRTESERALTVVELRAYARELAATDTTGERSAAEQHAVARADQQALPSLRHTVATMTTGPSAAAGVDPRTSRVVAAGPQQWRVLQKAQNRAVDAAESAGRRGDTLQYAVLLAALAQTLALLAIAGPAFVGIRRCAGVLLALAAAAAAGAYVL